MIVAWLKRLVFCGEEGGVGTVGREGGIVNARHEVKGHAIVLYCKGGACV